MFNANAVKTVDQSTVENEGPRYPTISFINGDPKQKKAGGIAYEGGWFIAAENAPADMTEFGWERDSIMTNSGKEIEGYWAKQIEMSIINHRHRWVVDGQGFPWNQYKEASETGSPRGHQQYLVLLKSAESVGPLSITLKGHAGMSFQGTKQYASSGALSCFNRTVISAANAITKPAKWPFRAFWLTVGAQKDDKGLPVFIEVGHGDKTSMVVLPVPIGLPEKAAQVDLNNFYVGDETLAIVNQLNQDSIDWVALWETKSVNENGAQHMEDEPEEVNEDAAASLGL